MNDEEAYNILYKKDKIRELLKEIRELKKELEDLKLINKINIAMDKGEQIKDIIKSLKERNNETRNNI